jgi:hypothetical protein
MAGTFKAYKDSAGTFRFRLKAGNGEIIARGRPIRAKPPRWLASSRSRRTHRVPTPTTRPEHFEALVSRAAASSVADGRWSDPNRFPGLLAGARSKRSLAARTF